MLPSTAQIFDEGRLGKPPLGWVLVEGYPQRARGTSRESSADVSEGVRLKTVALLEALRLLDVSFDDPLNASWVADDLTFPIGHAPRISRGNEGVAPQLSLSHSGSLLLVAAAGHQERVGVDIERMKPRNFAQIAAHLGWSSADRLLENSTGSIAENLLFYRRWTLAESLYKALGIVNLECFGELETLALPVHSESGGASTQKDSDLDLGWRSRTLGTRRWDVRWWQVKLNDESSMACVLRASER